MSEPNKSPFAATHPSLIVLEGLMPVRASYMRPDGTARDVNIHPGTPSWPAACYVNPALLKINGYTDTMPVIDLNAPHTTDRHVVATYLNNPKTLIFMRQVPSDGIRWQIWLGSDGVAGRTVEFVAGHPIALPAPMTTIPQPTGPMTLYEFTAVSGVYCLLGVYNYPITFKID
jgi:hypothetical protein